MRWVFFFFFVVQLAANPFNDIYPSSPDEIASLNPNQLIEEFISPLGQGYGYHEMVQEGYWLFGG